MIWHHFFLKTPSATKVVPTLKWNQQVLQIVRIQRNIISQKFPKVTTPARSTVSAQMVQCHALRLQRRESEDSSDFIDSDFQDFHHPSEEFDNELDKDTFEIEKMMAANAWYIETSDQKCCLIAGHCLSHDRDIMDCVEEILNPSEISIPI